MTFDQIRREFKRTLWGEELDNERFALSIGRYFELGFLHQYEGKKYRCICCRNEFEETEMLLNENKPVCINCF
jgi:hypothetical protein